MAYPIALLVSRHSSKPNWPGAAKRPENQRGLVKHTLL